MTRRLIRRLTLLGFVGMFVVAPIWGMMNCDGWNEGSGKVTGCDVDTPFLRAYAEGYYAFMLVSSFTAGVPILIYLALVWAGAQIAGRLIGWIAIRRPDGDS